MTLLFEKESYDIRGSVFDVYKALGSGHKETVYQNALLEALKVKNLSVQREVKLPVFFQEKKVGTYVPDFLINDHIVVELKAKPFLHSADIDQFWKYLTSTNYKLGFLINFGRPGGVEIIRRVYDGSQKSVPIRSASNSGSFRVALVHDSFTQMGGAERVIEALHELFPDAPIFTLVLDPLYKQKYDGWDIKTSPLQPIYSALGSLQYCLPLIPWAVDQLNFEGYDVIISSSSGFVKNIRVPKNAIHINYCHTPTRFLWTDKDYVRQEVNFLLRPFVKLLLRSMKKWDLAGAKRVKYFLANSKEVQKRIKIFYNRDSQMIYPFVDTGFWKATRKKSDYFLLAGRLQPHKRNEFIVEMFNELALPLHVVGTGRQEVHLKSIANENVEFLGKITDEELRDEYSGASCFIYPQIEDFGLMPLEAAACGTATLAFGQGGALETIALGKTGEFFESYDKEKIKQQILFWQPEKYSLGDLRAQAEKFSKENFQEKILNVVNASK